jgi:septum formation protein
MPEFYLASKSPRRSDLLSMVGADFEVISSDANEDIEKLSPSETVRILSVRKAEGALSYKKDENALIIASDTVVSLDGVIFGKPRDREDAYKMLRSLSKRAHEVFSGIAILGKDKCHSESVCTRVFFRELSDSEIYHYIDKYAPFDKAGAYGIQEFAGVFAEKIEGDINNVIGLPLCALECALRREFGSSLFKTYEK